MFRVIKIEDTVQGDYLRNDARPLFDYLNHGKESVSINLKTEKGKRIFYDLAKKADVIVEEFRPGVVEKLGIGYDITSKINPRLIYISIRGYDEENRIPGHDINYLSYAGVDKVLPIQAVDVGTAMYTALLVLSSLLLKQSKHIIVSMSEVAKLFNLYNIFVPDNILRGDYPCYNIYEAKDGKVSLGALEKKFWINMCNAFNRNDLIDKQLNKETTKEVQEEIRKRSISELMEMAIKFDIPFQRIRSLDEVRKEFKDSYKGPELGEGTVRVLKEIGYSEDEIRELEKSGVVKIYTNKT